MFSLFVAAICERVEGKEGEGEEERRAYCRLKRV